MHKLTAIIVDDEPESLELLGNILKETTLVEVVRQLTSAAEVEQSVLMHRPDVLFLDIRMPEKNGIELLENIRLISPDLPVIFVTAYNEHAIKALRLQAFDYLLKPVNRNDLYASLLRLLSRKNRKKVPANKIRIPVKSGLAFLNKDEILLLKAEGNYTSIELSSGKSHLSSYSLGRLMLRMPDDTFLRVSRSTAINTEYLYQINKKEKYCLLKDHEKDMRIPVSSAFLQRINDLNE